MQRAACHYETDDSEVNLDETARQRKIQLINNILADDTEIRNHTQIGWVSYKVSCKA